MDKTLWRVYRVERGEDVGKALMLFEMRMGKRPQQARVSTNAAAEVVEALKAAGLEVNVVEGQIASDVWLTDGAVVTEQLVLFGGTR